MAPASDCSSEIADSDDFLGKVAGGASGNYPIVTGF